MAAGAHGLLTKTEMASGLASSAIGHEAQSTPMKETLLPDISELASSDTRLRQVKENLERFERLFGADEDAYEQPTTSRKELWAYYLYYNGDNGTGPISYSQAIFQLALTDAGRQPGTDLPCTPQSDCVIPWSGGTKGVYSVVLIANGICFALMTVMFVWIGSAVDYGSFGRYLLPVLTVICWAFQYALVSIRDGAQWRSAIAFYIISYTTYGATLVFYTAIFPRLARYMPNVRKAREEDLKEGKISQEEYDKIESLERNHISNISTAHSNIGYLIASLLVLSILIPLQSNPSSSNYALLLLNSYWVALGVGWFLLQQRRPGARLPEGASYWTIGWKQVALALREIRYLPQTFMYLFAFFLLADGLNTTGTLVSIIQNDIISFSFLQLTYLNITQAICSIISTFGFWYIQKYFRFRTKPMFMVTNFFTVAIPFWGMLGLWTTRIGFHNSWELWMYNAVFGIFQAPYYAYSATMMSELTPRGYEGLIFGLFGITNRASSLIGPNVVAAIADATGNNWMGFAFLFAICAGASITIWFVDIERGRADCRRFVEERKVAHTARAAGLSPEEILSRAAANNLRAG